MFANFIPMKENKYDHSIRPLVDGPRLYNRSLIRRDAQMNDSKWAAIQLLNRRCNLAAERLEVARNRVFQLAVTGYRRDLLTAQTYLFDAQKSLEFYQKALAGVISCT